MKDYTTTARNAAATIARAGTSLPFRRLVKAFNPVAGTDELSSFSGQALPTVILPIGKDDKVPEGLVVEKARKLIVAGYGATFQLEPNDLTKFDGLYWSIKGGEPLQPSGGNAIIFTVFVERVQLTTADEAAFA